MRYSNLPVCLLVTLILALAGCNATNQNDGDDGMEPPPPPPPANGCAEDNPVCDPGCGVNQVCVFDGTSCGCIDVCPSDPVLRQCEGDGPNNGCGEGEICNAQCRCEPDACDEDAPVCPGNGPNAGCEAGFTCASDCQTCIPLPPPPPGEILDRSSRSTAIDLSLDDTLLAMVNSDDGSISFFNVRDGQDSRISRIKTSRTVSQSEPMSVVFHPDQKTVFVANRAAGTVSKIVNVDSTTPSIDAELALGGEPIGLALDPIGAKLWVTNWVNGAVYVVNTATMQLERTVNVGGNPWAIAITNDLDQDTNDERVLVTQFFARRRAGVQSEGTDDGREGVVHVIPTSDPTTIREITLAPVAECFRTPQLTSGCFPNQLYGITVHSAFGFTRAYVVSVAASPRGPVLFNHNVQALVSVIDLDTEEELTQITTNLNQLIADTQADNDGDDTVGRRFVNVPNAIDFVNRDDAAIGYVSSGGSDIVLRVVFGEGGSVSVGSQSSFNIAAGQSPQGLVITHRIERAGAFVANLISRDVSVISFSTQTKLKDIPSTEQPERGSPDFDAWRGKRFFNTATGIWSREGWGSCVACHPFGLTDNVTWQFAAGPRQTIALDGQFASNDPTDMRALNWTAIFDETADFEGNTRGTSGGSGAIRNLAGPIMSGAQNNFAAIVAEDGTTIENHQGMNGSLEFVIRNRQICENEATCPDWDQIDRYIQTIRSTNGKTAEAQLVARGREVFEEGGCNKCHAGAKWTISRTFYTQEQFEGEIGGRVFEANRARNVELDASSLTTLGLPANSNTDATLIAGDDSDGGTPPLLRMACNIRNVGTFGAEGGAEELRANQQPAQGRNGFNPPSLLSIATGAPYFHHGAAATIEEMFDARFGAHLTAGNPNFIPTAEQRAALTAFLLSIDETTEPFDILPGSIICPLDFSDR